MTVMYLLRECYDLFYIDIDLLAAIGLMSKKT
jgi:hypothetical protein